MRNVVIMGSGCAGLTAAIYTARANLKPLVIRGLEAGGQLILTTLVENFPGFPKGVQGPELIERMQNQAAEFGADFMEGHVRGADLSRRPFVLDLGSETVEASTLIVASGASAKMLGLESERKLLGHGVSTCATCDGYFYRGQRGGGRGRRRYGGGRGDVPHSPCHASDYHTPPRPVTRLQDHAGPAFSQSPGSISSGIRWCWTSWT